MRTRRSHAAWICSSSATTASPPLALIAWTLMPAPCGSLIDRALTCPSTRTNSGCSRWRASASVRLGCRSTAIIRGTLLVQPSSASSTKPDQMPNRPSPRNTGTTTQSGTAQSSDSAISKRGGLAAARGLAGRSRPAADRDRVDQRSRRPALATTTRRRATAPGPATRHPAGRSAGQPASRPRSAPDGSSYRFATRSSPFSRRVRRRCCSHTPRRRQTVGATPRSRQPRSPDMACRQRTPPGRTVPSGSPDG